MLRVNETKFLVQHEPCKCKCELNKAYVNFIQNKNGIMMNVGVSVNN